MKKQNFIHQAWRVFRKLGYSGLYMFTVRRSYRAVGVTKRLVPLGEWNDNWLGEDMRPFNSQH